MVTHRKALLALMDRILVLENSQLTDVNELGGLDAYLAKLEGLELEIAENKDVDAPGLGALESVHETIIDESTNNDTKSSSQIINNEPLVSIVQDNPTPMNNEDDDGSLIIKH